MVFQWRNLFILSRAIFQINRESGYICTYEKDPINNLFEKVGVYECWPFIIFEKYLKKF